MFRITPPPVLQDWLSPLQNQLAATCSVDRNVLLEVRKKSYPIYPILPQYINFYLYWFIYQFKSHMHAWCRSNEWQTLSSLFPCLAKTFSPFFWVLWQIYNLKIQTAFGWVNILYVVKWRAKSHDNLQDISRRPKNHVFERKCSLLLSFY